MSREVRDENGTVWTCHAVGTQGQTAMVTGGQLARDDNRTVLACSTSPDKAAVFVTVGRNWAEMPEQDIARQILESLGRD